MPVRRRNARTHHPLLRTGRLNTGIQVQQRDIVVGANVKNTHHTAFHAAGTQIKEYIF